MLSEFLHHDTWNIVAFQIGVALVGWAMTLFGAVLVFLRRNGAGFPRTYAGFLAFALPGELFRHKSVRMDLIYYTSRHVLEFFLKAPVLLTNVAVALWTHAQLTATFGPRPDAPPSLACWALFLAVVYLATDFAQFSGHYTMHKVRPLWQFHKTHHSVEFLMPLSARRNHPFEDSVGECWAAILAGIVAGGFAYGAATPVFDATIVGLNVYYIASQLSFGHLRHSHVDMSYGRLEKWLLSPAQHQLHHSREPQHWDKNFGLNLAIWDRLFGTFLLSEPHGTYRTGLPDNEAAGYGSVVGLYLTPFRNNIRLAATALARVIRPVPAFGTPPNVTASAQRSTDA